MDDGFDIPPSLFDPKLFPPEHCYVLIQDHGPLDGGWGPASVQIVDWLPLGPVVYTGSNKDTIQGLIKLSEKIAQDTGKPTRLVCFRDRQDVAIFGEE